VTQDSDAAPTASSVLSLTDEEARERGDLLAVQRYDVEVDLTDLPTGPEVRCVSTVHFTARRAGASTFVDCAAEVVEATLNGRELPAAAQGRIVLDDLQDDNLLVVSTVQAHTDGEGAHRCVDPGDDEVYLWMSFEPDEARHVWACFDQPDLKAPHAFTVTAPSAWTVVSNSPADSAEEAGDARVWHFADTPPLSTYNPVVLAGPLHEVRREVDGHDLGLFARRSLADVLDSHADELFELTGQGLEFFGRVFDLPFPQHKYDQVFLPEFGGAMENWGAVAWSDAFLSRAEPTPAESELLARVLLHEMAHMWFGNIVTMRWWDDLWLNEAFAEFAANWAMVRATRYTDAWAAHLADEKLTAYLVDQGPGSHPIRLPIPDVASAAAIFDAITYPKGASSLAQLMTFLGEEEFSRGMAAYFREHAWGNTTLQDLMDALSAASGRDLDAWREGWLETAGTDRIHLERAGDGFELVAEGPDGGEPRPHVLHVGAYVRGADGLERVACPRVEVAGRRTPVDLPADADVYLPNDDDLTFARVRPEESTREAFFALAGELPTPLSRGVVAATAWDMLLNGEARTAETVGCLARILAVETSHPSVEPFLGLARAGAELWAPDTDRPALQDLVAGVCRDLVEVGPLRSVALRGLARTVRDEDGLRHVEELAGDDVDVQWLLHTRRAEILGTVDEAAVQALQERDPDPDAALRAVAVRAALPHATAKEEVWQALTVDRTVPVGAVGRVTTAFWRPGQDDLLAPYAEKYLDLVPVLHRGGMIAATVFTRRLFPVFGLTDAVVERARAIEDQASPVVRRSLEDRIDEVRRMQRARAS
jgi:aminopeptidase N